MPKLNDTHLMLLAHAAQQEGGSLYPLPIALADKGAPVERVSKAVDQLIGRGLIEERETTDSAAICRTDGDIGYGQFISAIGLSAIGVDDAAGDAAPTTETTSGTPRGTKIGMVLALLRREQGATLAELIEATGWLPHTTRAALTGLRKKNHPIEKANRDGVTCYKVAAA